MKLTSLPGSAVLATLLGLLVLAGASRLGHELTGVLALGADAPTRSEVEVRRGHERRMKFADYREDGP